MQEDVPQAARPRNPNSEFLELRVANVPAGIILCLDAESLARGTDRGPVVIEILAKWAKQYAHETTVRARVLGSNPTLLETGELAP